MKLQTFQLGDLVRTISYRGHQTNQSGFRESGRYPIIDQGQTDIAGFTDDVSPITNDLPIVIFGDHTRLVKYASAPFVVGADGVKLIKSVHPAVSDRLLYWLIAAVAARIPSVGYGRHFTGLCDLAVTVDARPERRLLLVDALDKCELAITIADALIAATREQKRGLMQQLLTGKVRFPGFTEPWKPVRIGDVLAIDPEQLPAATPPDYTFKYIDLGSVNDGVVEVPTQPIDFATAPSRARRVLRQGDVLLSTVRPLLRGFGMIEAVDGPLVGSTGFAVLRTTRTEDARFILECLFSENVLRQMHARTTGSSYPALGSEDVRSLVIPWPSQSERSRIGAVLTAATKEIRTLAEARGLLATQRRGLMERLLSGEIDIPSSDNSAA